MVPVLNDHFKENIQSIQSLILSEVNVKELEFMEDESILVKKIKANFKTLGPKYGKLMKQIAAELSTFDSDKIALLEEKGNFEIDIDGQKIEILLTDVEILTEDIPGWLISTSGKITVALDITISEDLKDEGIARELVNRVQNLRKEKQFEVTDKISVIIEKNNNLESAVKKNYDYICAEILASSLDFTDRITEDQKILVELTEDLKTHIIIDKQLS